MRNKKYYSLEIVSIVTMLASFTIFAQTKILGPLGIVISLYLILGILIRVCKENEKFKNKVLNAIDLLFWLP